MTLEAASNNLEIVGGSHWSRSGVQVTVCVARKGATIYSGGAAGEASKHGVLYPVLGREARQASSLPCDLLLHSSQHSQVR